MNEKKLIQLSNNDSVIESHFTAKMVKGDKPGKENEPVYDFADEKKQLANGKMTVSGVCLFIEQRDSNGYGNGLFNKFYLSSDDVKKLYDEINAIESEPVVREVFDDLPF